MNHSTNLVGNQKNFVFLSPEDSSSAENHLPESEAAWQESELFLRKALLQMPQQGCALLYRHYFSPLCSHAVRFVYSKEIAEDLVAQVFCDFWEYRLYEQVQFSYGAFLYKMVRNRAVDHLRKELGRNRPENIARLPQPGVPMHPEQQMAFDELFQLIQQTVEGLPPQCKKIFLLSRFEGKKIHEIAESLQISPRTVETHISKALSVLRQGLKNAGLFLAGLLAFLS